MEGIIYKVTNLKTNKVYIGQTMNPKRFSIDRYFGSGIAIKQSIKKHGISFFKKEILGYCYSKEELDCAEKECIAFYCSNNKIYGYNISPGGDAINGLGTFSESHREKLRLAKIGNKNRVGKKHSEETKMLYRQQRAGKPHASKHKWSDEAKQRVSENRKGKPNNWNINKGNKNV